MALFEPLQQSDRVDVPPRCVVRLVVGALALAALYFVATADAPAQLPSVALKQEFVYRGELLLVIMYGGLLIATPVVRGVVSGLLPTEITARGAKYDAEQVSGGLKQAEDRIDQLNEVVEASSGHIAHLSAELARLREQAGQVEDRG
jgi:hypothetical protein